MSRKTTIICDRCGFEQKNEHVGQWEDSIVEIKLKVPPDGINGGNVTRDLCRACRVGLLNAVTEYVEGPGD